MANFVSNVQWDINNIDLAFYSSDNIVDIADQQGGNFQLNGTTYPDRLTIEAQSDTDHRILNAYGDYALNLFAPQLSTGTFNALQEIDVDTGSTNWFIEGFSLSASTVVAAALNDDLVGLFQSAFGGNDTITLSAFADTMNGFDGNDAIKGGGGDDILDGGAGTDTAVLDGSFASAAISFDGAVLVITTAADGTDRLSNFENVSFNGDVRTVASLSEPVNEAPVFPVESANVDATEDTVLNGNLPVATDANGDALTYSLVSGAANGVVVVNANGSYTYTPAANFNGANSFTAQVSDGNGGTDTVTINIAVAAVNDAPTGASPQALSTAEDTAKAGSASITDVDGGTLTYTVQTQPTKGTVTLAADGSFNYTPNPNAVGADTFTIRGADAGGLFFNQVFNVTVTPVNDPPVFPVDSQSKSTATNVALDDVLPVATDVEGNILTYSLDSGAANGTAVVKADGSFTYTPNSGFNGTDSFVARVSDGNGGTDTVTINVTVAQPNAAPQFPVETASGTTAEDTPLTGNLPVATDADGDALTYSLLTPAGNGAVTVGANGSYTYTPNANFNGSDSFAARVSDGKGGADTVTINLSVTAVNDAPSGPPQAISTAEDTVASGVATIVDPDGGALTYALAANAAHGNVVLGANGSYTYTPSANYHGADSFSITGTDASGLSATQAFNVTITPVNDGPIFLPAVTEFATPVDTPTSFDVRYTDIDNLFVFFAVSDPEHGVVTAAANGRFTYTPDSGFQGIDTVTFTITDSGGASAIQSYVITVGAPIA